MCGIKLYMHCSSVEETQEKQKWNKQFSVGKWRKNKKWNKQFSAFQEFS